jgi:hypothetical protein
LAVNPAIAPDSSNRFAGTQQTGWMKGYGWPAVRHHHLPIIPRPQRRSRLPNHVQTCKYSNRRLSSGSWLPVSAVCDGATAVGVAQSSPWVSDKPKPAVLRRAGRHVGRLRMNSSMAVQQLKLSGERMSPGQTHDNLSPLEGQVDPCVVAGIGASCSVMARRPLDETQLRRGPN